jgi:hypothetical protein
MSATTRCPHCRTRLPRPRPTGGQCPACRRLFVARHRVAYTAFSDGFLRRRVAGRSRDGAFRLTSLQLLWDAREQRPYPAEARPRWWPMPRYEFARPPRLPVVVAALMLLVAAYLVVFRSHWPGGVVTLLVAASVLTAVPLAKAVGLLVHLLIHVPWLLLRLPVRLVVALVPDRRRVVTTPSAFTAYARTVAPDLVDEHGMAPPPAPEPAHFAVLCADPAVAACLWANDVGDQLGALVVMTPEDIPRRMPVLDLSDRTPGDSPVELTSAVLRYARNHLDAARTGFLSWPVPR